jgi:pyruvyltransferase
MPGPAAATGREFIVTATRDRHVQPLKLYWSTSLQNGRRNFGDWLSPVLCEWLSGRPVMHARPNRCDLVGMGSILAKVKNRPWNRTVDIWGPGLIADIGKFRCPHRVHAVRGWRTAGCLVGQDIKVVGDPGLLCSLLVPTDITRHKKFQIGLIPHYVDQDHPLVRGFLLRHPEARLIDVFSDVVPFIHAVAECEVVLSSSLHGLITADALGVPNAWMRPSDAVWGQDFKFHDYYSIYGWDRCAPFSLRSDTSDTEVLALANNYARPGLDRIKQELRDAFPFKR